MCVLFHDKTDRIPTVKENGDLTALEPINTGPSLLLLYGVSREFQSIQAFQSQRKILAFNDFLCLTSTMQIIRKPVQKIITALSSNIVNMDISTC